MASERAPAPCSAGGDVERRQPGTRARRTFLRGPARVALVTALIILAYLSAAAAATASEPWLASIALFLLSAVLGWELIVLKRARERERRERRRAEAVLRQSNRALRLFSQCNSAVVYATEENALLREVCRIAVDSAGYRMAWVGRAECDERKTVRPVTWAGPGEGFLDRIHVSWADDAHGHGTAGNAIRTRKPHIGRALLTNPDFAVWREAFERRDFASAIAVPLLVADQVYGVLLVYAAEADAFDSTEVGLLEELGGSISHGMTALRAQQDRQEAMRLLERSRAELEERVAQRTAELEAKNRELSAEIEQRKQMERTLHESREKYRELVENANSIILCMDTGGRITFINEFAQQFFGFSSAEILGRSVLGTIVPEVESTGRDLRRMMAEIPRQPGRYSSNENENVKRSGERVWIAWTNRPIVDKAGTLVEVLCIGNDISGLKQAQQELVRAKEAAEAADRIKSAFLATMSHELRTPLNSIIGFSGILLRGLAGPLNEEQNKQLGMVQNSARHLLALINDVLDISKIEAGQLQVRDDSFDLAASVEKVVETIRPIAEKKDLTLELALAPGVGALRGDQRRVEQVLMNLLSNAVKFTERGRVSVACRATDDAAELAVQDTGIGIGPADQETIFRPFHQLDNGLTRRHEGTGLGLSISKRLIELMGGSIDVESQLGIGTTFTVRLPLAKDPAWTRPS